MTHPFVISDTHFWHDNIIKYCKRPFANSDEMNRAMIINWNGVVPVSGEVIHAGDFALGGDPEKALRILCELNGHIILIKGNHDFFHKKERNFWPHYQKFAQEQPEKLTIFDDPIIWKHWKTRGGEPTFDEVFISHYPTDIVPKNVPYHIHGHIHNNEIAYNPCKFNVSVEVIGYTPMPLDDIINIFEDRSNATYCRNASGNQRQGTV